jgi:hypothetical protein
LLVTASTAYAYSVNSRRLDDDPKKKDFHPAAIFLATFTWPFFLIAFISIFLIRAVAYGFFLILFTIFLIISPRESPEPTWLEKTAARIGERLLQVNTLLIKLFLRPWADEPETI